MLDILSIPKGLMESILYIGGVKLKTFLQSLRDPNDSLPYLYLEPSKHTNLRKLVSFADKEGKTRTIAIGDYLSQTVLRPFHLYLFRVLKKIPQDCTFDQGSFKEKIKSWDILYSVDLKSATDRFPFDFIISVIEGHLPNS